jgi:hypothetical protein
MSPSPKRRAQISELDLSGKEVLLMLILPFATSLSLLWILVKYWVFAP